ncbi:MAG: phospholipase [Wenzhouxiangella sp.]|nr:MAG: phospholipase [Wenzhouxiangella sp.]
MKLRKSIQWRWYLAALFVLWLGVAAWHVWKPLPQGLDFPGPVRETAAVEFLADWTWVDEQGQRTTDQHIFERKLELIGQAERLVVLDMFLFNEFAGDPEGDDLRPLASELTEALIERRRQVPGLRVIFITDPINTLYGGVESPHLNALRGAGVEVVVTDLDPLRDSNPLWSGLWRLCCRWFGNSSANGWLPNPVGEQAVGLRTWLKIANFKANHRKTLVVDEGETWTTLVTSANPHDASSAHGNSALVVSGPAALDVLETERAIAAFSKPGLDWPEPMPQGTAERSGVQARVLTEAAIRDAVVAALDQAGPGSRVDLAMFYLSHREVIRSLARAGRRGARIRLLLDPNEHAFGRRKNGIPNRPVAAELRRHDVAVRWCHTSGEQCHSKQLLIRYRGGSARLISGSANFTRRNLDNFNPETALELIGSGNAPVMNEAAAWFETRWTNPDGRSFSLDYDRYADENRLRYWQYRIMEATGLSTF